ncbi:MAG: peptidylprolyl isomerase [Coriobacteriia bacterium]|nr:peptidylprolyl isomerase [Coriobacteriia bacterium]MCL2745796.1 peptidylprolyl isomerase [Coriobacteriia bacterium]MCL2870079.1 peptidylprolyl isomerase [Coriobacteriia bacterium]
MKKILGLIVVMSLSVVLLAACGGNIDDSNNAEQETPMNEDQVMTEMLEFPAEEPADLWEGNMTKVKIEFEDLGDVIVELNHDAAPATVDNFLKLVNDGFYDGLGFHRIIETFMIQGGDPDGTGMGGSGENIVGEFTANGHMNPIQHVRGAVSMARSQDFNSASSQFFIVHQDSNFLDGEYAAFGRVVEGMDVVDQIAENTPVTDGNGSVDPANHPKMARVSVVE